LELLLAQIAAVEREQDALLVASKPAGSKSAPHPVTMLLALKSLGPNFTAVIWTEAFYRQFANRRQVAAYAGLAATPWCSGSINREQGVSKAGNPRLRTAMIQCAWLWLCPQRATDLAHWSQERVGARRRAGKTTIVGPPAKR